MPNWCSNIVTFSGDPEKVKEVISLFEKMRERQAETDCGQLPDFLLEKDRNLYYFFDIQEVDGDTVTFQSKWSPLIDEIQIIADRFGINSEHEYEESGMQIYGKAVYYDGDMVLTDLDNKDFNRITYDENSGRHSLDGKEIESYYDILEELLEDKISKLNAL